MYKVSINLIIMSFIWNWQFLLDFRNKRFNFYLFFYIEAIKITKRICSGYFYAVTLKIYEGFGKFSYKNFVEKHTFHLNIWSFQWFLYPYSYTLLIRVLLNLYSSPYPYISFKKTISIHTKYLFSTNNIYNNVLAIDYHNKNTFTT